MVAVDICLQILQLVSICSSLLILTVFAQCWKHKQFFIVHFILMYENTNILDAYSLIRSPLYLL